MPDEWASSDGWIFAAIALHADVEPAVEKPLWEIVARCDMIDHGIPNEVEFARAVARLAGVGLVGVSDDGGRNWTTAAGAELRRRWRGGLRSWPTMMPGLRRLGPPPDTSWSLPDGVYARAVQEWFDVADSFSRRARCGGGVTPRGPTPGSPPSGP